MTTIQISKQKKCCRQLVTMGLIVLNKVAEIEKTAQSGCPMSDGGDKGEKSLGFQTWKIALAGIGARNFIESRNWEWV